MRAGFASAKLIAKNGAASTRASSTAGFVPQTSGLNKKFGMFWFGMGNYQASRYCNIKLPVRSRIFSERQRNISKLHDGGLFMYSGNKRFSKR